MTLILVLALGLAVGVLVGLLGIGGGVLLVPAMVYLLHFDQHLAQGTSLFILLPPTGLGALRQYWRAGQVDLRAGICCAIGFLLGGYVGGRHRERPLPVDGGHQVDHHVTGLQARLVPQLGDVVRPVALSHLRGRTPRVRFGPLRSS